VYCGLEDTSSAVSAALNWLKAEQAKNGKFHKHL